MYINAIKFNSFPTLYKSVEKTNSNQLKDVDLKDLYPQNYNNYLSFGRTSLKKEDFPSERLYEIYSEKSEFEKSTKLYDVHKEYYANLLRCEDINDVKIRYPEFQNVKVASYLKDYRHKNFIRNLAERSNGELTLANFSLKLLQDYYSNVVFVTDFAKKYGTKNYKINELMEVLNIPAMSPSYINKLSSSRKDTPEDALIKSLPTWQQRTIAKSQSEVNAPNKIEREQMLKTIHKTSKYQQKLDNASFVAITMPILFEEYNNPKFRQEAFSIITDKLADKWQDDRYVEFIRKEPIEKWEKDLTDKLSEGMSDSDKKKMKVYINSAILSWKKQPTLNTRIYKEMKLTPTVKEVVEKAMNGKEITFEDEKVLKYFHSVCAKKIPRYSQIIFEQQKELLTEWSRQVGQ